MRTIWQVFARDIKKVSKSKIAIIIMLGLMILPSLYAWLNIKASWDPYGNTQNIKIGVCSVDKGSEFLGNDLNIGDGIVDELKNNNKIGWTLVNTPDDVIEGVTSGNFYAGIVIPEDYSENFVSITTTEIKRPQIKYYVNQKINAISPKITDNGVASLQEQINQTFIKLSSDLFVNEIEGLKKGSGNESISNESKKLNSSLDNMILAISSFKNGTLSLNSVIKTLQASFPYLSSLLEHVANGADGGKDVISNLKQANEQLISLVESRLSQFPEKMKNLDAQLDAIFSMADKSAKETIDMLNGANSSIDQMIADNESMKNTLNEMAKMFPSIKPVIDKLIKDIDSETIELNSLKRGISEAIEDIKNTGTISQEVRNRIKDSVNSIYNDAVSVHSFYKDQVAAPLSLAMAELYGGLNSSVELIKSETLAISQINESLTHASDATGYAATGLDALETLLTDLKTGLTPLENGLNNLNDAELYKRITDLLKNNPEMISNFVASPVTIDTNIIYPVENYGSAMTPFYTVLAIWVGSLLMVSLISVKVKEDEKFNNLKSYQTYFSRYFLFGAMGIIQTLIITLGDIFILGIYCVHKVEFLLFSLLIAIIFSLIIYSLVATFGNIGKAIALILLVIQVAGSGGTFPIELTSPFFRVIQPLLPFTYANGILRETIGGIYAPMLRFDVWMLLIFIPIMLLIVFMFRSRLEGLKSKLESNLKKSDIIQ